MDVESNFTCPINAATSLQLLASLDTAYLVLIIVSWSFTVPVCVIYAWQCYEIRQHLWHSRIRNKTLWLLGIYPVFSVCGAVSVTAPRSVTINEIACILYLSMCIYHFMKLMIYYYGGADEMVKTLTQESINLRSPPCCCCCCCLPKQLPITRNSLKILTYMVLQVTITRPFLYYVIGVLWSDGTYQTESLSMNEMPLYAAIINASSSMLALYGLIVVFRVSRVPLYDHYITPKFLVLKLAIFINDIQAPIFAILGSTGVFVCTPLLPAAYVAQTYRFALVTVEMFFVSLFARFYYKERLDRFNPDDCSKEDMGALLESSGEYAALDLDHHSYGSISKSGREEKITVNVADSSAPCEHVPIVDQPHHHDPGQIAPKKL